MTDELATIAYLREQVRSISKLASDARQERDQAREGWRLCEERLNAKDMALAVEQRLKNEARVARDAAQAEVERLREALAGVVELFKTQRAVCLVPENFDGTNDPLDRVAAAEAALAREGGE